MTDLYIRHCIPCDFTWCGPVPCWLCGCEGTREQAIRHHHINGPDVTWETAR